MVENRSSIFGIIAIIIGATGLGFGAFSVVNFQTVEGPQGPPGNDGQNGIDGEDGQDAPRGLVVGILDPDQHETVWGEIEVRALVYGSNNYSVSVKANQTEIGTQLPIFWNTSSEVEGWYNLTVIIMDNETKEIASDTVWILIDNPVSSEKDITAFYFPKWANPDLPSSIVASIDGTIIIALLPEGSNVSALVASFTTTGVSVEVNNVKQISEISENNFHSGVEYVVFAEDGSTKSYTIIAVYRKTFTSIDTPLDIPDNDIIGVTSTVTVADLHFCVNLSISVSISDRVSDIGNLRITLTDPDNVIYTLYDGGPPSSGPTLITTFPTPTLPVNDFLTDWVGRNPAGVWLLNVVDLGDNFVANDGILNTWSVIPDIAF